jgi:hypothetical protein
MTETFHERQARFVERLRRTGFAGLETGTIVVMQSLSYPLTEARKIVGIAHYDERMLCLLLTLRDPDIRIVFVSSTPIDEEVVDYYLGFIPEVQNARDRLKFVTIGNDEPRALSQKLFENARALDELRDAIDEPDRAYILPFNVTPLEVEVADAIGVPLYGPTVEQIPLGSKSGGRRVARSAGVPVLAGAEDLFSMEEVDAAIDKLRGERPSARAAVIKLNNGFSGQGNCLVYLNPTSSSLAEASLRFCAEEESYPSYEMKVAAEGAVVEELVREPGMVSPSVQMRIAPGGDFEVVSTHDQILGGPDEQVYLGCSFPARSEYREEIVAHGRRLAQVLASEGVIGSFGIDFVILPEGEIGGQYMSEINLRLGGTTHPYLMARLATNGTYDPERNELLVDGVPKYYESSDNLKSPAYVGMRPTEAIEKISRRGIAFDLSRRTGVALHLLGALPEYGKVGCLCVGDSPEEADELYREVVAAFEEPSGD